MSQAGQVATILIVEDDENLRLALTDNLEDEGYGVLSTARGGEARAWRRLAFPCDAEHCIAGAGSCRHEEPQLGAFIATSKAVLLASAQRRITAIASPYEIP